MKLRTSKHFYVIAPLIVILAIGFYAASARRSFPGTACTPNTYSGVFEEGQRYALYKGERLPIPPAVAGASDENPPVLGVATPSERWIEVDLSDQKLIAWDGGQIFLETPISSGLPWYPTPKGEFRIWVKLRYTKMEGGQGNLYYYLPNVPYTMFFENEDVPNWRGYGLHGTYWHNDFGTTHSHGCVNLPTEIAGRLYYWVGPTLPEGKSSVFASPDNPGTRIIIHE